MPEVSDTVEAMEGRWREYFSDFEQEKEKRGQE